MPLPQVTYQSTYKWDDRVLLCIGSIESIQELEGHLKDGEALAFDEEDDSKVFLVRPDQTTRTTKKVLLPTTKDMWELASVRKGLQASPTPSTGYVLLSSGYTIALVTLD